MKPFEHKSTSLVYEQSTLQRTTYHWRIFLADKQSHHTSDDCVTTPKKLRHIIRYYAGIYLKQRCTRANTPELRLFDTQRPHTDGIKLKTDTVPNDETSEIERDLCAFGSIGGCPSSYQIALIILYLPTLLFYAINLDQNYCAHARVYPRTHARTHVLVNTSQRARYDDGPSNQGPGVVSATLPAATAAPVYLRIFCFICSRAAV